jgi:integrating conjugative element protein (TIGR03761 family)
MDKTITVTAAPAQAANSKKAAPRKTAKKAGPVFPISDASPFPDRYDFDGEGLALRDLIDADEPDSSDPRYSRYIEWERRKSLLEKQRSDFQVKNGAEAEVPYNEAMSVKNLGKLTDESEDLMLLHTREASRLFIGRAKLPGETGYGQSGGKKVGAALRAIWYLSGSNNPYADFALVEAHANLALLVQELEAEITKMEGQLSKLQRRGLTFSVIQADPPAKVELGFRSPYGYSVVMLISTFDYFVRLVKTLVRKDMLSDKQGYQVIWEMSHKSRRIFERVVMFQRYLTREELRQMSRGDWLPTADADARKRVKAAVGLFGELPRDVFTRAIQPRHSRLQADVTPEELRLLNEVPLVSDEAQLEAAASLQ